MGKIRPHVGDVVTDDVLFVEAGRRLPTLASSLLVQARQRSGLTQVELARRAGTSRTALSAIEHGRRDPGLQRLQAILLAAGFDLLTGLTPHDDHDDVLKELGSQMNSTAREDRKVALRDFYEQAREAMKSSTPLPPG